MKKPKIIKNILKNSMVVVGTATPLAMTSIIPYLQTQGQSPITKTIYASSSKSNLNGPTNIVTPFKNISKGLNIKYDEKAKKRYVDLSDYRIANVDAYINDSDSSSNWENIKKDFKEPKWYVKKGDAVSIVFRPSRASAFRLDSANLYTNLTNGNFKKPTILQREVGKNGIPSTAIMIKETIHSAKELVINNPSDNVQPIGIEGWGVLDLKNLHSSLSSKVDWSITVKRKNFSQVFDKFDKNSPQKITKLSNNDTLKFTYKINSQYLDIDEILSFNNRNNNVFIDPSGKEISVEYRVNSLSKTVLLDSNILKQKFANQWDHQGSIDLSYLYTNISPSSPIQDIDIRIYRNDSLSNPQLIASINSSSLDKTFREIHSGDKIMFQFTGDPKKIGLQNFSNEFIVPQLKEVSITNPFSISDPWRKVSGTNGSGKIDISQLNLDQVPQNAKLEIKVVHSDGSSDIIRNTATEINNLSNGDYVEFTYDTNGDYVIDKSALGGHKVQTITSRGSTIQRVVFDDNIGIIKGLGSDIINVNVLPTAQWLADLRGQFNYNGKLDLTNLFNNRPQHIDDILIKVNGAAMLPGVYTLKDLSENDRIEIGYKPDNSYRIHGPRRTVNKNQIYWFDPFKVLSMKKIKLTDPLPALNPSGRETHGEIDLSGVNLVTSNHLKFRIKVKYKDTSKSFKSFLIDNEPKKIPLKLTDLSNGDEIYFTYTTIGNYDVVYNQSPQSWIVDKNTGRKNVWGDPIIEREVFFNYTVSGLDNNINLNKSYKSYLDIKLASLFDHHGEINLRDIPMYNGVERIQVKVNGGKIKTLSHLAITKLQSGDRIEFIYTADSNHKLKFRNSISKLGGSLSIPIYIVPEMKKISITDPTIGMTVSGREKSGKIDLKAFNIKRAIKNVDLVIKVKPANGGKTRIIPSNLWDREIDKLSNNDEIIFRYRTRGDYVLETKNPPLGYPKDIQIKGNPEQEIEFSYTVYGLNTDLKVSDIDRKSFGSQLNDNYDRHGTLDISQSLNLPTDIREIKVTIDGKPFSGQYFQNLHSGQRIVFTYVPDGNFKIKVDGTNLGSRNNGDSFSFPAFVVPELKKIDVKDPTPNILQPTGVETEGVLDLSNLNFNTPKHARLSIMVNNSGNSISPQQPTITGLSNKDTITFKYTTIGDYLINSPGAVIKDITLPNGSKGQEVSFTYGVSGLSNKLQVLDIDRNSFNKKLSGDFDHHGSLDFQSFIINKHQHIKNIRIEVNGKATPGSINGVLNGLKTGDTIQVTYVPDGQFIITNRGRSSQIGGEFALKPYIVPKLKTIDIKNPLPKINVTGIETEGEIDLKVLNLQKHNIYTSLEITVTKGKNTIKIQTNQFRNAIKNLSNNDIIKFTYTTIDNYVISPISGGSSGVGTIDNVQVQGKPEQQIVFTHTVSGLSDQIKVDGVDPTWAKKLSGDFDHHGSLDIQSFLSKKPNHIKDIRVEINGNVVTGPILSDLKSGDQIQFTYVPESKFKVEGPTGVTPVGADHPLPVFIVPKLKTIDIKNPLPKINVTGIETEGLIDLKPLSIAQIPNINLKIKVGGRTIQPQQWNTAIDMLSNNDVITFTYTTIDNYVITPISGGSSGVGTIDNVQVQGKPEQQIVFTYTVSGLSNEIKVSGVDPMWAKKLSGDFDHHGSLDIQSFLRKKPNHIKDIRVEVNGNVVTRPILNDLKSGDQIQFTYVPESKFKVEGPNGVTPVGADHPLPVFIVPKLKTIDIKNPLPKINVTGIETEGVIDLKPLSIAQIPNTKLEINVGNRKILQTDWAKEISNLSNNDAITFTYTTIDNYVITPISGGSSGVGTINNVQVQGKPEQQIVFTHTVSGLSNEIKVSSVDPMWAKKLSGDFDHHGSLDIQSFLRKKPNHIKDIRVKVNGNVVIGPILNNLKSRDQIQFTYVPESKFKVEGPNGITPVGADHPLPVFIVPKLKTIDIKNPLPKINVTGIETEGVIDLKPLSIVQIPNTKLEINVGNRKILQTDWAKEISNLSNNDVITFTYTTIDNYVITPISGGSSGVGTINNVQVQGKPEQQIVFSYTVSGLNNKIWVNDIKRTEMTTKLVKMYKNHGSLDMTTFLKSKPKHIKKIQIMINDNLVSGNILDNLSSGDKIKFIFVPEAKFKVKSYYGESPNIGDPHSLPMFIAPKMKLLQLVDPTIKMSVVGINGTAKTTFKTSHYLKLGYVTLKITIKHLGSNRPDDVRIIPATDLNVTLQNLSNNDQIEITYYPSSFSAPKKPYVIDKASSNGTITFTYKISALAAEVDNTKLTSLVKLNGTNELPNIDIDKIAVIKGTHLEFSLNNNKAANWISQAEMIKHIKSTKGKNWTFQSNIFVRYVADDPKVMPIIYKKNIKFANITTDNLQMMVDTKMMQNLVDTINTQKLIAFKPGSTSVKTILTRTGIATEAELKAKYGLKLLFSNDGGANWSDVEIHNFDLNNPQYWLALVPVAIKRNVVDMNASTNILKFDNISNNIIKLDVKKIPILVDIEQKFKDDIQKIKLDGQINTNGQALNWTIDGNKTEPQSIKDMLVKYGKFVDINYSYNNISHNSLSNLMNNPIFDKDKSDNIKAVISLKASSNGQIYKLVGSINGKIEFDIPISSMIQMISLTTPKGDLSGKEFVNISVTSSQKINVHVKDVSNLTNVLHAKHLSIKLQMVDKTTNQPIGNKVLSLNDLDPAVKYQIIVTADNNWNIINSKNPISNSVQEIRINMLTILEIANPIITKVETVFEKFEGKGKITSFKLKSANTPGSSNIVDPIKNHMDIWFAKDLPSGQLVWVKWDSPKLNDLSNGDVLKVKIYPKLGYKFTNNQNMIDLIVNGLFNEVNLSDVQVDKNLTFSGNDGHGSIDENSIHISSLNIHNSELIKLINQGIVKINFYATDKSGKVVKFDGQINNTNNNNLSVGDKIQGYFQISEKFIKTHYISNNPNDVNNKIYFNDVFGLKVHPSVLGNDSGNDALKNILNASMKTSADVLGNTTIKIVLSSSNNLSTIVPANEHWHWEYGTSVVATLSNPNPPIVWKSTTSLVDSKTNWIENLLKSQDIQNTTIYVRLKAEQNYILDNPSYAHWQSDAKDLKNYIDVSKLGNLDLKISGINEKADVNPVIIASQVAIPSQFTPPINTHLEYAKVSSDSLQTGQSINGIKTWSSDVKQLKIKVGDYIVARLKPDNANTLLSNQYFTKKPALATNLTIDMSKVNGLKVASEGINKYGTISLDLGSSDVVQTTGIIWKVIVNSKPAVEYEKVQDLKNNDIVKVVIETKPGYILPNLVQYQNKLPSMIVKGLKEPIFIKENIKLSLDDDNIFGLNYKDKKTIILTDPNALILNGFAFVKDTSLMSYNNGAFSVKTSINDINTGKGPKLYDAQGNVVNGLILTIFFQKNDEKPSEIFPTLLKNGYLIKAFVGISSKTPSNLLNKFSLATEDVRPIYSNLRATYRVHGLAEQAPDLGKINVKVPELPNTLGTIIIETGNPITQDYNWSYRVTHEGKPGKWSTTVPNNLSNGDIVEYKLTKNSTPILNDYASKKEIKGLLTNTQASPEIEKMINDLYEKMAFEGDNGSGKFTKETRDQIANINHKLQETYKNKSVKLIFNLLESSEPVGDEPNKLSNNDKLSIKILNNIKLNKKYIKTATGLREADPSVDKTLIWGIVIGTIGIVTLGIGFAIYALLSKRRKFK